MCAVNGAGQAADGFGKSLPAASIIKPTLKVGCVKDVNYWKQPAAKNFWSWMPRLRFAATGPIDDGSYFTFDFFNPDGKAWYSIDSDPFAISPGDLRSFESEAVPRWTDKRSSISTGIFGFRITLKNSLQGTSKVMYEGKFKVGKAFAGTPHPEDASNGLSRFRRGTGPGFSCLQIVDVVPRCIYRPDQSLSFS